VNNVSDVRQIEVHMAEPLVPGPSRLQVEIAIAKLKKYESPGSDQIPTEPGDLYFFNFAIGISTSRRMEPLIPGPIRLEVEIPIAKLKNYKSSGSDEIPTELIQAGAKMLLSAIHKLINSVWIKKELPDQWKGSIIVPIHKKGDKTDCNNYRGISLPSTSYKILSNILL
jgi:hypothetical protein